MPHLSADVTLKPLQREIIAVLARSGEELTPKELSSRVTSTYGSVRNIVGPMTDENFLMRVTRGRYTAYDLGPAVTDEIVAEALESHPEVGKSLQPKQLSGAGIVDEDGQKGGRKPRVPFAHSGEAASTDRASERVDAEQPSMGREAVSRVRKPVRKGDESFGRFGLTPGLSPKPPATPVTLQASQPAGDPPAAPPDSKLVEIPLLVDIAAEAAGPNGGFLVDSDYFEVEPSGVFLPDTYIRQVYGVSPERVFYIHGRGRSMVPTIMPGQRVMIALLTPGTAIRDGLIYVIDYAAAPLGGVLVKRLELLPDHVNVVSDNADVEDYQVPFEVWQRDYELRAVVLETAIRH